MPCERSDDGNLSRRDVPGVLDGVCGRFRGVLGDRGAMAR